MHNVSQKGSFSFPGNVFITFPARLLTFILILTLLHACQNISDMEINYDSDQPMPIQETANIKFRKSWKRWDKPSFLRLYDYDLQNIEEIHGVPCIHRLTLDSLGNLYGFILAKEYQLNGNIIPAGSRYETRLGRSAQRIGYMIYLSEPCEIQGYYVRNEAGMEDYKVDFYSDGGLKEFKVYEDVMIGQIPCKGDKEHGITLYPDGKAWVCYLSKDTNINGARFSKGSHVIFDTSGNAFEYSLELHLDLMGVVNEY